MKAFKKKDLYKLKAAINGFTTESRRIRAKEINPKSLKEKERGWERKRSLGLHSRFHQLAYALMLGKRYDDLEPNRPLFYNSWQTGVAIEEIMTICRMYGGYRLRWAQREFNQEAILHWLKTGENQIFVWDAKPRKFSAKAKVTKVAGKTERVA